MYVYIYIHVYMYECTMYVCMYMYMYVCVFHKVIWPTIGTKASYLALHSSLIGVINYDYIVITLLIWLKLYFQ